MTRAAPEPVPLALLRALLPDAARVELAVLWAQPFEVVLSADLGGQRRFLPPERLSPEGFLVRRPVGDVVELLHHVGARDAAHKIGAHPPPEGHVWVVQLRATGAQAVPWPWLTDAGEIVQTVLDVARPDLAAVVRWAQELGVPLDELAVVVGHPAHVQHVTGRGPCGHLVTAREVTRRALVVSIESAARDVPAHAEALRGIARDLAADVPPGHLRVLVTTAPSVGSVVTIVAPGLDATAGGGR